MVQGVYGPDALPAKHCMEFEALTPSDGQPTTTYWLRP